MTFAKESPRPRRPYPTGEIPEHGDIVRIPADQIECYKKDMQSRLTDRLGYIRNFSYPNSIPLVMFAGAGRRKPLDLGQVDAGQLEFVARKAPE